MPTYIIKDTNGEEINRIVASENFVADNYDFYEQAPDPIITTTPEPLRWPLIDFRKRFYTAEKVALYQATETDIMIKIFMDDLEATPVVAQDDPELNQGIAYVVAQGILTLERAREILDNPTFSIE
ncbi:hypothetical protein [Marinobacterium iners]|uniref:Uncharacterized protein n=1 Tax=Marinobacterium iners DSM 11526 TaxID=1122198 RepID=A0A1H3ZX45_9GAMM|nr:hypothetical protein [Marinobacterium iners]SEA28266.1 hypothetical protein SAMN02745729_102199 [Marinobacterium iners DSM 11526]